MKKAKKSLASLSLTFAIIALAAMFMYPGIEYLVLLIMKQTSGVSFVDALTDGLSAIVTRLSEVFGGIVNLFSADNYTLGLGLGLLVFLVLDIVFFIVAMTALGTKKRNKPVALAVIAFIFALLAALTGLMVLVPELLETGAQEIILSGEWTVQKIADYATAGVAILALLFLFIHFLTLISYAKKTDEELALEEEPVEEPKEEEPAPVEEPKEEEPAPAPVVEKVVERVIVAQPEQASCPCCDRMVKCSAENDYEQGLVRRILIHRSGKVVRVINEHYYDVTTHMYVEPGKGVTEETEQEHFQKLLGAQPAPVAEPAPAPAPAPVAEPAPAPAPAPVAEPAPAQKVERIPFATRLHDADKALKAAYNELKSEILSYGIKSRISSTGDTFRLHTKAYVKIVVAGKSLKLYMALNPADYKDSTYPIGDASSKGNHADTPLVFKVKSDLSVRRAKTLIADCAAKDGLVQGEVIAYNHAKEVK